ncbi:MAG: nickel-dependent lactate racemase [Bacillota bacterium]|nr:nickel-dependent lactate racemase [Bacillota bacterium]
MLLDYGKDQIKLKIPEGVKFQMVSGTFQPPLNNPEQEIIYAIRSPIGCPPLSEIIDPGDKVCILVNDSTRVARSEIFLPVLIDELDGIGIKDKDMFIVFTNGTHRALSKTEMKDLVGNYVASKIALYNHDSRNDDELVYYGTTSFDTPVYINSRVAKADKRILTGSVVQHYFAGYGGGRKALVPGAAGWKTIEKNHSLMLDEKAAGGILNGNPVHEDLLEAALMVGGNFLINTVLDEEKAILGIYAGDMIDAHLAACKAADKVYNVEINQLAEVVIASCGGYPKDINLYQAHKTLDNALNAMRPGGNLILLAECEEGMGSTTFKEWTLKYCSLQELRRAITNNFVLGGHKAYTISNLLRKGTVYLVSRLDKDLSRALGFIPVEDLDEALAAVYKKTRELLTYVIPQGAIYRPILK